MGLSLMYIVTPLPSEGPWGSARDAGRWEVGTTLTKNNNNNTQPPHMEQNKLFRSEQSNKYFWGTYTSKLHKRLPRKRRNSACQTWRRETVPAGGPHERPAETRPAVAC